MIDFDKKGLNTSWKLDGARGHRSPFIDHSCHYYSNVLN